MSRLSPTAYEARADRDAPSSVSLCDLTTLSDSQETVCTYRLGYFSQHGGDDCASYKCVHLGCVGCWAFDENWHFEFHETKNE